MVQEPSKIYSAFKAAIDRFAMKMKTVKMGALMRAF